MASWLRPRQAASPLSKDPSVASASKTPPPPCDSPLEPPSPAAPRSSASISVPQTAVASSSAGSLSAGTSLESDWVELSGSPSLKQPLPLPPAPGERRSLPTALDNAALAASMGFFCVSNPPPALVAPPSPCLQPQRTQSVPPRVVMCDPETLRLVIERSKRLLSLQSVSARVSAALERLVEQRKGHLQQLQGRGVTSSNSELLRQTRVLLAAALQNQAQIRDSLQMERERLAAELRRLASRAAALEAFLRPVASDVISASPSSLERLRQQASTHGAQHANLCSAFMELISRYQRELLCIFPIEYPALSPTAGGTQVPTICGLEIPELSPQNMRFRQESCAAALGLVCRLTIAVSQLWRIPLRYPLIAKSSRSELYDTVAGRTYPLYWIGAADRQPFSAALPLLQFNIGQLMATYGMESAAGAPGSALLLDLLALLMVTPMPLAASAGSAVSCARPATSSSSGNSVDAHSDPSSILSRPADTTRDPPPPGTCTLTESVSLAGAYAAPLLCPPPGH